MNALSSKLILILLPQSRPCRSSLQYDVRRAVKLQTTSLVYYTTTIDERHDSAGSNVRPTQELEQVPCLVYHTVSGDWIESVYQIRAQISGRSEGPDRGQSSPGFITDDGLHDHRFHQGMNLD